MTHEERPGQSHSIPDVERTDGTRDSVPSVDVVTELTVLAEHDRTAWPWVIPELARIARRGEGADRAVETLGRLDDDAAYAALLGLAREPDSSVVPGFAVLSALLMSPRWPAHRDEGVLVVAAALRRSALDADLRAGSLFQFSNGWAALRAVLAEPGLHPVVVRSMGWTDDRTALGRLLERLATAPAPETVLEDLGMLGDPGAIVRATAYLSDDLLADMAAEALSRLGPEGARTLLARLDDPVEACRRAVARVVRDYQHRLVSLASTGLAAAPETTWALVLRATAALQEERAVPAVFSALSAESPVVRLAAVDALAVLAPSRMPAALLDDAVTEIRAAAARAVPDSRQDLRGRLTALLLSDPSADVRAGAAAALGRQPGRVAVTALRDAIDDADPAVQVAATASLAGFGPAQLPVLIGLLAHPDTAVRHVAADGVAALGDDGADAIRAASTHPDPLVRATAARAAGSHPDTADIAQRLLDDDVLDVRVAGLNALAGPPNGCTPRVVSLLHDGTAPETAAAAAALTRLAGPAIAEELIRGIESGRSGVVRATLVAIRDAFSALDVRTSRFPDWFLVESTGYVLIPSAASSRVLETLRTARRRAPRVAEAAAATLAAVAVALDAKLRDGLVEQWSSHFRPPSGAFDRAVIADAGAAVVEADARHLDVAFRTADGPHPDGVALHAGSSYLMEVAVRTTPTGIPPLGTRAPLRPLPAAVTDTEVDVDVVVETGPALRVEQPVGRIRLPVDGGDSQVSAVFRVHALTETPAGCGDNRAELRIRLFHRLNLLESAIVRAEVISRFRPGVRSVLALAHPVELEYEARDRSYSDLVGAQPRSLHIDVDRVDHAYQVRFTWYSADGQIATFPGPLTLQPAEVARLVADARRALLDLTVGSAYATTVEVIGDARLRALRAVAAVGRDLRTALFLRHRGSAMAEIGRMMRDVPLPEGSTIQVSVRAAASDFLVPWALVYDGELPESMWTAPAVDGFWGARYAIEQRLPDQWLDPPAAHGAGPSTLAFLLWEAFPNAAEHLAAVAALAGPALQIRMPPINRASAARTVLTDADGPDILYFFTHAHTRQAGSETLALLRTALHDLAGDGDDRALLARLCRRMAAEADQPSWIGLTHGRLALAELYGSGIDLVKSPLVILNACESAQLTPALTGESFVDFFLDRGARTVIGTECTMTVVFARPFAELLLRLLGTGTAVGEALRAARRHFLELGNPLGLAYSLYGSADLALPSSSSTEGTSE